MSVISSRPARPEKKYGTDGNSMMYHYFQCGTDLVVAAFEAVLWVGWGSWVGFVFMVLWLAWFFAFDLPRYRSSVRWHDEQAQWEIDYDQYSKDRDEKIRRMFDKNYRD